METDFRLLARADSVAAADLHRAAGALIPGYDVTLHSAAEFVDFYRDSVLVTDTVWGAFDKSTLLGFVALLPGWVDHLYVDPRWHGRGIGSALIRLAQREQGELRLYTFQSNARARRFYEWHGFAVEEFTDGQRNSEKMPDMTYHWSRSTDR